MRTRRSSGRDARPQRSLWRRSSRSPTPRVLLRRAPAPQYRRVLVDWITEVGERHRLDAGTIHVAVSAATPTVAVAICCGHPRAYVRFVCGCNAVHHCARPPLRRSTPLPLLQVSYLDRLLQQVEVARGRMQLAAITSVVLAGE
jgi:hypothetical protein